MKETSAPTFDYISNGRVIQLAREKISCGCCRGPEHDRCCCHIHQDRPRGVIPKTCSVHEPILRTAALAFCEVAFNLAPSSDKDQ